MWRIWREAGVAAGFDVVAEMKGGGLFYLIIGVRGM
jgi:hypothetical protein